MAMLSAADGGLRGLVVCPPVHPPQSICSRVLQVDEAGRPVGGATVRVLEIEVTLRTTERGEWWRLVAPGVYTLQARSATVHNF